MTQPADCWPDTDLIDLVDALIQSRQHISPQHLTEPGPSRAELLPLLEAAAAAPDHGLQRPWRFIAIGPSTRVRLAEAFAQALLERDPQALPAQLADARAKAHRGPALLLAVADLRPRREDGTPTQPGDPAIAAGRVVTDAEKLISLGCAIQNLLLAAQARGWASGLTSGRALTSQALRHTFALQDGEHAICFVNLGTARKARPRKPRPRVDEVVSWLA